MSKRPQIISMLQLPPPMHGAARMNQHAVNALRTRFDVRVIEMRFPSTLSDVSKLTFRKCVLAIWLAIRLITALPSCKALYICFAPTGAAYYRDCLYVLLAKLFQVPAILHLHGRGLPRMRQSRFGHWFQNLVFSGQTVILLGERLRSEIDSLDCNARIIRNCVEENAFTREPTSNWKPHDAVRIAWISNLFRAKGIETLIEACALLRRDGCDCQLKIAGAHGDVNAQKLADMLLKHGMQDAAEYVGKVSASERSRLFSESDLFVLPSNYPNEAQPLVVLEAMAAGVPVITSDIATLPEFVLDGETGRLCPPNDTQALARTIQTACRNPEETTRMRDAAYTLCRDAFGPGRFEEDLVSLISTVVKR